jgi:hypothetical protein
MAERYGRGLASCSSTTLRVVPLPGKCRGGTRLAVARATRAAYLGEETDKGMT